MPLLRVGRLEASWLAVGVGRASGRRAAGTARYRVQADLASVPEAAAGAPDASRLRCASLQVPLNYSDPGGRKITLALSEIPATAPAAQRQGVLLVNPGGPGAPACPWRRARPRA